MKKLLLVGFLALALILSGCVQPQACTEEAKICPDGTVVGRNPALNCEFDPCPQQKECAEEGEEFSDEMNCCGDLVKAVITCEKCKEEGEPLAFDGIPCCEGLEAVDGFCRKPGEELPPSSGIIWDEQTGQNIYANEVLVGIKEGISEERVEEIAAAENATIVGTILSFNIYQFEIEGDGTAEKIREIATEIAAYKEVEYAEPNYALEFN